ncbi:hypothetical protein LY90DRAFT_441342, partial [Neocallimastix californiae]
LRADTTEPTYLRTKLACDIHNRLGLSSLSANYAVLYINDEYMGLFIFTDAYKESWIEYVYGEKNTTSLYQCSFCDLTLNNKEGYENENKESSIKRELYEFLGEMTKAKSLKDVESILDLDQFLKELALEYLFTSWDHLLKKHNYYIYLHPQTKKWIYLLHDFDLDFGIDINDYYDNDSEVYEMPNISFQRYVNTIEANTENIIKKFILEDEYQLNKFKEIVRDIVIKIFNPAVLFPHIDKLKAFIRPYIELEKQPDEHGKYPGNINENAFFIYSMKQWEESTEFTNIKKDIYGLKLFILLRYRYICRAYRITNF